jgi:hypothetical protein
MRPLLATRVAHAAGKAEAAHYSDVNKFCYGGWYECPGKREQGAGSQMLSTALSFGHFEVK